MSELVRLRGKIYFTKYTLCSVYKIKVSSLLTLLKEFQRLEMISLRALLYTAVLLLFVMVMDVLGRHQHDDLETPTPVECYVLAAAGKLPGGEDMNGVFDKFHYLSKPSALVQNLGSKEAALKYLEECEQEAMAKFRCNMIEEAGESGVKLKHTIIQYVNLAKYSIDLQ